jgi:hypothetical protein
MARGRRKKKGAIERSDELSPSDWDDLTTSEVCLVWNAHVYGKPILTTKSFTDETRFNQLTHESE